MATTVGNERNIEDLLLELLKLEHDALAGYDAAIEHLEDPEIKTQVTAFREDHASHISDLDVLARELSMEAPSGGGLKKVLTSGKVLVADLFGDEAILKAMILNEDDTVTAYERAADNVHANARARSIFQEALADERRHRSWMKDALSSS
ncbi:DUF2383 domain-containing protein [Pelagibacterium xiamenense]|uniref:DUF2383 domain-containing protein n=1 Tax=Pelagibacterium xiamenense TaxID=2901140 RepID=UPI001E5CCC91|nr:DUF2383 domain-containing protein [Pelagibacterium xiamenense]MCD7058650.1 PA2169 family four-helix-bundle protein [Pelagibacterium xiamenense]